MAKIVKKKKKRKLKKINLGTFTMVFALFSACAYLASSLFLRTYNNNLSTQAQSIQAEITTLETQNNAMAVENSTLATRDRVDEIVAGSGMSVNQGNVITISDPSGD